jgi:hypothetical protein
MSYRILVELNTDYAPQDEDLDTWAHLMLDFMRTGKVEKLPRGVTFKHWRHHSEPDPMKGFPR